MTKCAKQHEEHYPVSYRTPGRESGVTTDIFYSAVNVTPAHFKGDSLHTTTITNANGMEQTFITKAGPSVLAHIRVGGGWVEKRKHLEHNPETGLLESKIVANIPYTLEDFALTHKYNAGNNVIWAMKVWLDERFTMNPRFVILQLTEGQARRIIAGGKVPIHAKPYCIDAEGLKPHKVEYINSQKKQDDEETGQIALFNWE